jgi:hypothetical protein
VLAKASVHKGEKYILQLQIELNFGTESQNGCCKLDTSVKGELSMAIPESSVSRRD